MFEEGDRVELVQAIEVFGLEEAAEFDRLARFTVVGTKPGLVTVTWGDSRLTLPARLLRRV